MTTREYKKLIEKEVLKFQLLFDLYCIVSDAPICPFFHNHLTDVTFSDYMKYNRAKTLEKVLGKEK